MLRPTSEPGACAQCFRSGRQDNPCLAAQMSDSKGEPGSPGAGNAGGDLDQRRQSLETALAQKKAAEKPDNDDANTGSAAGFAAAMKLSSEFIAGVVVGAALGWFIDRFAGTSPWGLIVFLLLGFAAGVLNVLRSAGKVAYRTLPEDKGPGRDQQ